MAMTALEESILETEKELKELEKEPDAGSKEVVEKALEEEKEDPVEKPQESSESEPKDEGGEASDESENKQAKSPSDHAKERITIREERERRIQAEIEAAKAKAIMEERERIRAEQQKKPETVPDPDLEPEEYLKHEVRQMREDQEKIAKYAKYTNEQTQALRVVAATDKAEAEAIRRDQDYLPAKSTIEERQYQLLKLQHEDALRAQYPQAAPEQIDGYLRNHAKSQVEQFVMSHVMSGKDITAAVKEFAKVYGFTPGASKQEAKTEYKPNLSNIKKNMEKSAGMIGGSAKKSSGAPTPEEVVDMALEDMLKMSDKDLMQTMQNLH